MEAGVFYLSKRVDAPQFSVGYTITYNLDVAGNRTTTVFAMQGGTPARP